VFHHASHPVNTWLKWYSSTRGYVIVQLGTSQSLTRFKLMERRRYIGAKYKVCYLVPVLKYISRGGGGEGMVGD